MFENISFVLRKMEDVDTYMAIFVQNFGMSFEQVWKGVTNTKIPYSFTSDSFGQKQRKTET